ncbi:MAG TPA: Gfo/Idh/MocA family oxidoreductase [Bryobacteraceae bacterium]|nr:Gfo/Idh/MocA family oxidoreductase [Bryobacteraceae bacterium]
MNYFDRRHFLFASAAAAQAALAQQTGDRIGTAMIGTGNRGSHVLRGVLEQPNARVVALCDIKPDRLDAAASSAAKDNPKTYTDWRRVIDNKEVEAVFIATPPHLHAEMAIAALKAGKHVYCEKPIGVTADQVKQLVRAAKGVNKVFVSGQQLRSHQQLKEAVSKIHQGELGELLMVKAQRHATTDLNHEGSSADWYFDVTKSGGYLIEQSVHNLDACNWVIGAHPTRATGFGGVQLYKNDPPGRTIMDNASLTFEYPSGLKLSFTQNVFHPSGMPCGGQYIHVFGSKASVDLLYAMNEYPLPKGEVKVIAEKRQEPQHAHTTAFYDCIVNGAENPADITVGATAALTSILGHEAMVRERVVNWRDLGVEV